MCAKKCVLIYERGVLMSEIDLYTTIGTSETVLISEVSLYQRLICTQNYTLGTSETVLIRKAYVGVQNPYIRSVLYT